MNYSAPPSDELLDGRYRLHHSVGAGGTAVVYRATDERLGRVVAVKVLRPALAQDPTYLERFVEEAQRAAQVSHPHIAAVLDVNAATERPYIVMEFVDGVPLGRLAPLPIGDAVEYVRQASDALQFLHRRQLVHGDVKPDNLLVTKDGQVKLVDLGIARPIGSQEGTTILGSPAYVAPERLRGAPLSPPTDVYGLGVALFEALTGRPPFIGETAQVVAAQTLASEPPVLSDLRPEVPLAVEAIVAKAMAKDPQARYPDMTAFGRALAGLQMSAGQSTGAMPRVAAAPPPPRVPPPSAARASVPAGLPPAPRQAVGTRPTPAPVAPRRGPGLSVLSLFGLLLLLACGIVGLTLFQRSLQSRSPATAAPLEPTRAAATATRAATTGPAAAPTSPTVMQTAPRPTATQAEPTPTLTVTPSRTPSPTPVPPTATPVARTVEVPGVTGMPEKDARKAIEAVGLRVGRVMKVEVAGVREDTVWRQSLAPAQRVERGTTVDLIVAEKPGKAKGKDDD